MIASWRRGGTNHLFRERLEQANRFYIPLRCPDGYVHAHKNHCVLSADSHSAAIPHRGSRTEQEPRLFTVLRRTADQGRSVKEELGVNALVSDAGADPNNE
jgi:hypothetical protein